MYYVYELIDPRVNLPFYVGKGKDNRVYFHLSEKSRAKSDNQRKFNKIQKIRECGYEPEIKIVKYFDIEVRNKKEFADGTQTTLQFSRKNKNDQIDVDEMKKVLESLNKKANDEGDNLKIMIRALNIDKWYTFKGFDTDLEVEEFEDYFKDKVKNGEKFEKFSQMQITTFKTKK
jgi:hypothetical protein